MKPVRRLARSLLQTVIAVFVVTICDPTTSHAQDLDVRSLHWAYASYFGTGWYAVGDNRNSFVMRMTPRWEYRAASLTDDGDRSIGIYFKFPVTAGLETFELGFDEVDTIDFHSAVVDVGAVDSLVTRYIADPIRLH